MFIKSSISFVAVMFLVVPESVIFYIRFPHRDFFQRRLQASARTDFSSSKVKNTPCSFSITPVKHTAYLALFCLNYSKIKVSPNVPMAEIALGTFFFLMPHSL